MSVTVSIFLPNGNGFCYKKEAWSFPISKITVVFPSYQWAVIIGIIYFPVVWGSSLCAVDTNNDTSNMCFPSEPLVIPVPPGPGSQSFQYRMVLFWGAKVSGDWHVFIGISLLFSLGLHKKIDPISITRYKSSFGTLSTGKIHKLEDRSPGKFRFPLPC